MMNSGPALYPPRGGGVTVNGKYVIERRLGGGGMAEVFLARTVGAEGFSRPVAIKRVLAGFSENPHFSQLFVSEAQLTSRLQHPNIVSVLDFDRDHEGHLFLVMELVDGTDLDGLLATGALPIPLVIYLATEILRGLDFAHELPHDASNVRGIIHRDISPHNVLLSWNGAVKVSDFGIAKARAASNASASIQVKGKPAYMSPEHAKGEPLDGRSDLFSVGVMLFEMLCLRQLFAAESTTATIAQLLHAEIPAPREVRPEVPEDLSRVVSSLLSRDRNARPANAAVAREALVACADYPRDGREALVATLSQRFVGRAPVRARGSVPLPDSLGPRSRPVVALPPEARTLTPWSGVRFGSRRRWLWPLLAMFVAAGTAGGIVIATRHPSRVTVAPAEAASRSAMTPPPTVEAPPHQAATVSPPASGSAAPAAALDAPPASSGTPAAGRGSGARPAATTATVARPIQRPESVPSHRVPAHHAAPPTEGIQEIQLGGH